jgi:signal transduction histidine kinase
MTGNILVVDDDMVTRMLLTRGLTQQGHTVAQASDGTRALEMLREGSYDAVLLDVEMPGLNGFEVLAQIESDEELRRIPVVMVSGVDEMSSVVRCVEMGAADYLHKPFDAALLRARVDNCLQKKRAHEQEIALRQELEDKYRQLQESERMRDSLTHMIVHDLRTPLTSLLTGMQSIESFGEMNELQREFVDISISGGEKLLAMINDLLDISKMESGEMTLERAEFPASTLAQGALQQIEALALDRNLTLQAHLAPALHIRADEQKLLRVLVNLLGNAVKFTPRKGSIQLSAHPDGQDVRFSVADTGEGIPPEAFERIFEKFGQVETRQAGRQMSTGLGLTFCKLTVEAHGGRIWVESEPGQGSKFLFTIPQQALCV